MATTSDYLTQLQTDKETLKTNLQAKGVEVLDTDTFTEMSAKVNDIQSGVDINEYFAETIKAGTGVSYGGYLSTLKSLPAFKNTGTSCKYMFAKCKASKIDLSNFDTSNVTDMLCMFSECSYITNLDTSSFNTSKVTSMNSMFSLCSNITNLDLSSFDTSQVTTFSSMFKQSSKLNNINLSSFNTSNANAFGEMFYSCGALSDLNLSNFDFGKATSISSMLFACSNLQNLTFGINLGKGYTQKTNDYNAYKLTLSSCANLTHDSLMSVINNLYDLNLTYDVANGGTLYTQSLVLGATNIAKLSEAELDIARNKGWTIS